MKAITFPFEVKRGSVSVKIYRTPTKGCESFTLSYYQDGKRKRPTFAKFEEAEQEARIVAAKLASSNADVLTLTSAGRASYLRAREVLDPLGISLEAAAAEVATLRRILGDTPPTHAAEYFVKRHPTKIEPKSIETVIEELLTTKRQDRLSEGYLQHLRYDLEKFNEDFQCDIGTVTGTQIDDWLRGLGLAPRTRNNLRTSIKTLFNFAIDRRYLPKDHDELDAVKQAKDAEGEIEVFTPAELTEVLAQASEAFVPFLVLAAFAGVRHAEIKRLEWSDIRLDDGFIEIRASKAKTASRRLVPIQENLNAWLLARQKKQGLVCAVSNTSSEMSRMVDRINAERRRQRKEAGLPLRDNDGKMSWKFEWKHNALRHSYISYRVAQTQDVAKVSLEAGNSPQMIFKHYRELVRPKDAEAWFNIKPAGETEGKVVQLEQKVA